MWIRWIPLALFVVSLPVGSWKVGDTASVSDVEVTLAGTTQEHRPLSSDVARWLYWSVPRIVHVPERSAKHCSLVRLFLGGKFPRSHHPPKSPSMVPRPGPLYAFQVYVVFSCVGRDALSSSSL